MKQKTIGIRELKEQLSGHIREVRNGATLVITDRGRPVARLLPIMTAEVSLEERLQELVKSGAVSWSGRKLSPPAQTFPVRGPKTVAEMLLEDRD